jgi:predicted DNA-binding transcriptional regulator YafY
MTLYRAALLSYPVSMSRADRLLRLLSAIRRLPPPVTAARLAAETEVSARTLYRDIASLRAGGALIDGEPGLGYTLTEDPALPPQMFTRLEIEALVLGLAEVQLAGDPALVMAAQAAQSKIIATLPERVQRQALHAASQIYRFERRPPVPDCLPLLREAIWEERAIAVAYTDREGQETRRVLWPLSVVFMDRTLMLLAWCTLRQGFRRFRLEALEGVGITAESFRPRRVALLREFVAQLKAGR